MERANITNYRFNQVNNARRTRRNNKRGRYPDNNKKNDLSEASVTTRRKLGRDGSTKSGGTRLIFLAMILTEIED